MGQADRVGQTGSAGWAGAAGRAGAAGHACSGPAVLATPAGPGALVDAAGQAFPTGTGSWVRFIDSALARIAESVNWT